MQPLKDELFFDESFLASFNEDAKHLILRKKEESREKPILNLVLVPFFSS